MSRTRQRIDRINAEIPIAQLLADYGYQVRGSGDREEQFPCDLHGDGHDGKPSARAYPESNSWYCVSTQERVLTSQGWLTLEEIQARYSTLEVLDGLGSWAQPNCYLPRPVARPLVRVQTKAGYSVAVTPDHELEVKGRGWIQAQDLRPGDVLVVTRPQSPRFSQSYDLPYLNDLQRRHYKGQPCLQLPSQWSLELGECLGYVFGDGWVTVRAAPQSSVVGLTSHATDAEDARRIFRSMQKWAGGRGSEIHRTDPVKFPTKVIYQDQYVFTIGNDGFAEFLVRLGLDKQTPPPQRRLPNSVWTAPEEGLRGFLRGAYATDGSVFRPKDRDGIRVNLYSVSGGFLSDVQLLLLQFGIYSRLYKPAREIQKGKLEHPCWYLQLATGHDILRFRERIGIANQRKQAALDSFTYCPRGSRPFRPVVESVTAEPPAKVADLSMPLEHSFVAGGLKVHNCFACGKSRDAIATVRAKEDLGFNEALTFLEKKYNLPALPWEDEYPQAAPVDEVARHLDAQQPFALVRQRLVTLLEGETKERHLPMDTLLAYWEALDKVSWQVEQHEIEEWTAKQVITKLRERLLGVITNGH